MLNEKQIEQFEAVTRPVIEWLNANCNPHTSVVVDATGAVLQEGALSFHTDDYLKD